VFAGAVRETVFSREDVVRRINTQFVPVALKAALVNNPPDGIEGAFIAEISRSKPAPQGVCVANGAGKVLAWTLSFDNDAQVPKFLDHALDRHKQFPDAKKAVPTQRFQSFPGRFMREAPDTRVKLPTLAQHGKTNHCPATPPKARGTLIARVWGRRVEKNGELCQNCISQENYIEDIFDVPIAMQREVARAAKTDGRFRLPDALVRHMATYTYLGQLDVRPIASPVPQSRSKIHELEWWAEPAPSVKGSQRYCITGKTDVETNHAGRAGGVGRFHHRVSLQWRGFFDLRENAIINLGLWAEGQEQLQWGNRVLQVTPEPPVARLMAGKFINLDSPVRYGITGQPARGKEVWQGKGPPPSLTNPTNRLQQKMQRLQQALRRVATSGGDPRPIQIEITKFQRLIQQGKHTEAEEHLDRALALANAHQAGIPNAIDGKLRQIRVRVEKLIREGKKAEADQLLDRFLRDLKTP